MFLIREGSRLFNYQQHLAGELYVSKLDYLLPSSKSLATSSQKPSWSWTAGQYL